MNLFLGGVLGLVSVALFALMVVDLVLPWPAESGDGA